MFILLLISWGIFWILRVASRFAKCSRLGNLLEEMNKNMQPISDKIKNSKYPSYNRSFINTELSNDDKIRQYNLNLTQLMPKIKDLNIRALLLADKLTYKRSITENFEAAITIYQELLSTQDQAQFDFKKSLNPVNSIIPLFELPSRFFSTLGLFKNIKTKSVLFNVINIVTWCIGIIATIFPNEIKEFLLSWIK